MHTDMCKLCIFCNESVLTRLLSISVTKYANVQIGASKFGVLELDIVPCSNDKCPSTTFVHHGQLSLRLQRVLSTSEMDNTFNDNCSFS